MSRVLPDARVRELVSRFFAPWERRVAGWRPALNAIDAILEIATSRRTLVWRGVCNAEYPLHSSLYRHYVTSNSRTPDESDLVKYELALLDRARTQWRFDDRTALELLAQLQHFGGPTRLIDVSFNPLVALWFAVEKKYDDTGAEKSDADGRLFAFDVTDRQIGLTGNWAKRELPWRVFPDDNWRRGLPKTWRPPSYNDRIPAQNSAFLVGGVPQVYAGGNMNYRREPGDGTGAATWPIDDVRQVTSVTLKMNTIERKLRGTSTPTFTLRIDGEAKEQIREKLEQSYGFNTASIYPDMYGLAQNAKYGLSLDPS